VTERRFWSAKEKESFDKKNKVGKAAEAVVRDASKNHDDATASSTNHPTDRQAEPNRD